MRVQGVVRCERYGGRCLLTGGVRQRARRKRWSSGGTSWPRYGGAPLLPAAGWCARWVWSTRGVREKRRQPVRGGGAGASVRVGRKGCWVQGAGKRGGVMNRNDTVAGEYRAVVVYRRGKAASAGGGVVGVPLGGRRPAGGGWWWFTGGWWVADTGCCDWIVQ